jgi:hypothetical protein
MRIVKLKYTDKTEAIEDLIAKGIYIENEEGLVYGQGVHAVVEVGLLIDVQPTFDEDGNQLTEAIYFDGYHYDLMIEDSEIVFEKEIEVSSPKHKFAGF